MVENLIGPGRSETRKLERNSPTNLFKGFASKICDGYTCFKVATNFDYSQVFVFVYLRVVRAIF